MKHFQKNIILVCILRTDSDWIIVLGEYFSGFKIWGSFERTDRNFYNFGLGRLWILVSKVGNAKDRLKCELKHKSQ